jgi:hypothetical protein
MARIARCPKDGAAARSLLAAGLMGKAHITLQEQGPCAGSLVRVQIRCET